MPRTTPYSVFICHDWEYSYDYQKICEFLDRAGGFNWWNLSVPEHDPLDTDHMLEKNLRDQIRPANIMLVLAGMYTARSGWMDWEMAFARRIGLPIIGIVPQGNKRIPIVVQSNAREIVGWYTPTIINAISNHAVFR